MNVAMHILNDDSAAIAKQQKHGVRKNMNILAQDIVYENIISQPSQGFIPSIAKYVWQLCIFVGILFLIHQIYEYLKKSFTTPIKTNLVQLYQNKYNEIVEQHTKDEKSYTSKVTQPLLHLPLLRSSNSSKNEEKFDSEELSSTQKEYLSRELLDMIQKSI